MKPSFHPTSIFGEALVGDASIGWNLGRLVLARHPSEVGAVGAAEELEQAARHATARRVTAPGAPRRSA